MVGRLLYPLVKQRQDQVSRERMSDRVLIIAATGEAAVRHQMEMQRRLKDAVENLTVETVTSRESSERLTGQLDASIGSLTAETVKSRESAERLTRWLIGFTAGLLILTAVLVALTVILARRG